MDVTSYVRNQLEHMREKQWNLLQVFKETSGLCVLERPIGVEVHYYRGLTCISTRKEVCFFCIFKGVSELSLHCRSWVFSATAHTPLIPTVISTCACILNHPIPLPLSASRILMSLFSFSDLMHLVPFPSY